MTVAENCLNWQLDIAECIVPDVPIKEEAKRDNDTFEKNVFGIVAVRDCENNGELDILLL